MASPFEFIDRPTDQPALVDARSGRTWTQDEFADAVRSSAAALATGRRELVFCLCSNDVASIRGYLSAIAAGHAVALLDAAAPPDLTDALVDRYRPAFIVRSREDETPEIQRRGDASRARPANELAVLLSTSGTTGSPKLVRLAHRNIEANATSIAEYLEIDEHERAIQSLPIHYSYGLSVLNSHLASGASVILRRTRSCGRISGPTLRAGGPRRSPACPTPTPSSNAPDSCAKQCPDTMRTLTQAGGRLAPESHHPVARADERTRRAYVGDVRSDRGHRAHLLRTTRRAAGQGHTIGIPIPGGD